jgi:hypothetical protein
VAAEPSTRDERMNEALKRYEATKAPTAKPNAAAAKPKAKPVKSKARPPAAAASATQR